VRKRRDDNQLADLWREWLHRQTHRARSASYVWGEVRDEAGHMVSARLKTLDGYSLTVLTALAIVDQALGGRTPIGFQTPARAYGADLIFSIGGVTRLP
jgi:short subunit dehydrogenase-like uncharacterized protein